MLLENPQRVDEGHPDWLEIHSNNAFILQRYRRGGIGKGLHTIQSLLTVAKLVHGSPRMASAGVPWDFRIITAFPVRAKPQRLPRTSSVDSLQRSEDGETSVNGDGVSGAPKYVWQLAGSNNLLNCKQDMDVLVGKLNFLMTDVDMSTLLSERKEPTDWIEKYSRLALLLESIALDLQARLELEELESDVRAPSPVPLLREPSASSSRALSADWSDVMQLVVFVVLPPSDLFKCAQVCRAWSKLASHDVLWEGHLAHLNAELGIMESHQLDKAVGRMVVDGVVTYKLLYTATFLEAVRRRSSEATNAEDDEEGWVEHRLHDVADHDVRRVMVRGLFGVTLSMKTGLQEVGKGIKDAGSGVAVGAIGGLLAGGLMAAKLGGRAPMGDVTRSVLQQRRLWAMSGTKTQRRR